MSDALSPPYPNPAWVRPGIHTFNTTLPLRDELAFQQWVKENAVPFDTRAPVSDYDMRGFYQALNSGNPLAQSAMNANDGQMHYPDYWKTPYHQSFSADSQWASPAAPQWTPDDKLVAPDGTVVFDERAKQMAPTQ